MRCPDFYVLISECSDGRCVLCVVFQNLLRCCWSPDGRRVAAGSADRYVLERCLHFTGWYVQASMELGPEDVSLLERCPHFRGWCVQASMELGPEDVSLLERCPHFRGWYVQASMELGPEDVSLLERCPQFIFCIPIQVCIRLGQASMDIPATHIQATRSPR